MTDYFFELFDATHSAIEYRYPHGARVPGGAPVVILGAAGLAAAALICLDPGHGTPPAVGAADRADRARLDGA